MVSLKFLNKPRRRRRRQRGRGKTKDLMSRTIAQYAPFKTVYFSAVLRKLTTQKIKICFVREKEPRQQIIKVSIWELNAALIRYVEVNLQRRKRWSSHLVIREIPTKINIHFQINVFLASPS